MFEACLQDSDCSNTDLASWVLKVFLLKYLVEWPTFGMLEHKSNDVTYLKNQDPCSAIAVKLLGKCGANTGSSRSPAPLTFLPGIIGIVPMHGVIYVK